MYVVCTQILTEILHLCIIQLYVSHLPCGTGTKSNWKRMLKYADCDTWNEDLQLLFVCKAIHSPVTLLTTKKYFCNIIYTITVLFPLQQQDEGSGHLFFRDSFTDILIWRFTVQILTHVHASTHTRHTKMKYDVKQTGCLYFLPVLLFSPFAAVYVLEPSTNSPQPLQDQIPPLMVHSCYSKAFPYLRIYICSTIT
jgi:hypothetical protein